ncbi:MAG: hypothetical protein IJH40_05680 [Ruminococcus sp.]|uniref:hypothetical protein n=1 Tax=Ruminococcus sp. TaxID=41978 RepID=UPI00287368B3|nr:hypothetical protein [Ruminococcus sp.]MBQ3285114.1 hypothetical protein [Ruminococcus sp.]
MPQQSLEQEAMERVRRMYAPFDGARADTGNIPRQPRPAPQTQPSEPKPEPPKAEKEASEEKPSPEKTSSPGSLLDIFMKDKDQSLILLLLVLLMKDGADMNLTLALMYLLI